MIPEIICCSNSSPKAKGLMCDRMTCDILHFALRDTVIFQLLHHGFSSAMVGHRHFWTKMFKRWVLFYFLHYPASQWCFRPLMFSCNRCLKLVCRSLRGKTGNLFSILSVTFPGRTSITCQGSVNNHHFVSFSARRVSLSRWPFYSCLKISSSSVVTLSDRFSSVALWELALFLRDPFLNLGTLYLG